MKSLLDNPVVKDIMSKPDLYAQLIASNPYMAEIVQVTDKLIQLLLLIMIIDVMMVKKITFCIANV